MKTIGIIGGLGPMATVYYLELITRMTDAKKDQEHPRILMHSLPDIPDRTAFILGDSKENPLPVLIRAAKELEKMGADFISIPCVTAQYFYEELSSSLDIPVLSLCGNIATDIAQKNIKKVGIMATSGTIQAKVLEREFGKMGVEAIAPEEEMQKLVMGMIYEQVKKGEQIQWMDFLMAGDSLKEKGAEKIILGCTELSVLKRDAVYAKDEQVKKMVYQDCVDVLEVLAQKAVIESGAILKGEYRDVIH